MKLKRPIFSIAASTLLVVAGGCDKKDQAAAPESAPTTETPGKVSSATEELKQSAANAAAQVKETAGKVATEVKETTQNVTAAAASKVDAFKAEAQNLIEKTRTFIAEKKYQDALNSLNQLSKTTLTVEQQKTVEGLKAQVQKLVSSQVFTNTAATLNNLLKK